MNRKRKILAGALTAALLLTLSIPAFATSGDVAGAVEQTWTSAQGQIKTVVNNVVFPVLDVILAVLFFVKVGSSYFEYRKHAQVEFAGPAILFACLLFTLTAPLYIWGVVGKTLSHPTRPILTTSTCSITGKNWMTPASRKPPSVLC